MTKDRIIEMYVNCSISSELCKDCLECKKEECDTFFYRTEASSKPRDYTLKEVLELCSKGGILDT